MRSWSLARQLLALQLLIVTVAIALVGAVVVRSEQRHGVEQQRERVLALAQGLAVTGQVREATRLPDPSAVLQPLAEELRGAADLGFVTFMTPEGTRWSHPTPGRIGQRFVGEIAPARAGRAFTEQTTGTLGPSVRAVAPITADGRITGLVAVGVLQEAISAQLRRQIPALLGVLALTLALAGGACGLLARRVRRQTRGLDPQELAALYAHHDAVLHAIGEGIVVVGTDDRVLLANAEARTLLALEESAAGRPIADLGLDPALADALRGRAARANGLHVVGDRVLVAEHRRAPSADAPVGTVTTLRDRTQLDGLMQELTTVRGLVDALRAQAHESANELHTVVGLVELGRHDDAVSFATRRIAITQVEVDAMQQRIGDPALVALLLAKAAMCRERGVELVVDKRSALPAGLVPSEALVTITGNLVDNALDALAGGRGGVVTAWVGVDGEEVVIEVRDGGPGIDAAALPHVFEAGWTTKPGEGAGQRGLGLALVRATAERLGGSAAGASDGGAVFTVRVPSARVPA